MTVILKARLYNEGEVSKKINKLTPLICIENPSKQLSNLSRLIADLTWFLWWIGDLLHYWTYWNKTVIICVEWK